MARILDHPTRHRPEKRYKGPEGHENDRRLPDGEINWDYVGSEGMTLRQWYEELDTAFEARQVRDGTKTTPDVAEQNNEQFEFMVDNGLIT